MGIVMMETTMLVVLMMEVIAALVLIHHMDGILTALFVIVRKMVMIEKDVENRPLMFTAMMNTIMLIVTMMVVLAVIIHYLMHILTALFVNVFKVDMNFGLISHFNLHEILIDFIN